MPVTRHPRTDPYVRHSRIRLLPRMRSSKVHAGKRMQDVLSARRPQACGWIRPDVREKNHTHKGEDDTSPRTHDCIGHSERGDRAADTKRWYQPLKAWWAAGAAARQQAKLAALKACWDAPRETVTPRCADAAPEMAIAQAALTICDAAVQPHPVATRGGPVPAIAPGTPTCFPTKKPRAPRPRPVFSLRQFSSLPLKPCPTTSSDVSRRIRRMAHHRFRGGGDTSLPA